MLGQHITFIYYLDITKRRTVNDIIGLYRSL